MHDGGINRKREARSREQKGQKRLPFSGGGKPISAQGNSVQEIGS
jgi:hypothetical protein